MVAGLDAIKKGKNRGKKGEKGRGAMQKKVTFGGDRVRKSGGITPTLRVSNPFKNIPTGSASYRYE